MTDAVPPPPAPPFSASDGPRFLRLAYEYLSGGSLLARALLLAALTLTLKVPLSLVGGVVADRQGYEQEAVKGVQDSWGRAQVFVGPMITVPYKAAITGTARTLTLLPRKLTINGEVAPQQRKRGLFAVTVYRASFDVVAEFPVKALRETATDNRTIEWLAARLTVGLSEEKSIEATTVEIDGTMLEWTANSSALTSLQADLGALNLAERDTVTVHFHLAFAGSGALSIAPLGQVTEASLASSWPSPSFMGRYPPSSQTVADDGFRARWTTSHLGRRYGQLWDSGMFGQEPAASTVLESAFGVTLIDPVDAYRQTDRAIKYGVMFIGLTFAAGLLFELATGTRPHAAQYGLIGLALCVFYLLLLSLSEQIGFGPAYLASGGAVVAQATLYTWALQRHPLPAALFGFLLAALYAGLYVLLQLEGVALLSGSVLLFVVLSLAMWFTRNLHRTQPA